MELQQLRYVLAVAEERNFTRAAQRCHIVQSAMSHQIKTLEREIGVQLFARTSRRVDLTSAGTAFLPSARASVEAADRAVIDATATGELSGTLTMGVIPTVTAVDIPAVIGRFRSAHPRVRMVLRTGGSEEFVAAIANGAMDVALLGLPDGQIPANIASRELARQRLVAVVSSRHRLAERRRIRLSDLAGETFVDFPTGTAGRAPSERAFAAAGIAREVPFEAMSMALILDLIRQDVAVALLSPEVVPSEGALRTITMTGGPVRVEHLGWSNFNPSPAAQAALEALSS